MKFRTALLLGMLALLVGLSLATVSAVAIVVERSAQQDARADLLRSRDVFLETLDHRRTLYRSEGRMVSEEPRLKAVVASDETSPETVLGVLAELRRALGAHIFLIADENARIIADVQDAQATGRNLGGNALITRALAEGQASDVWVDERTAHQVQGQRLGFGQTVVGVLAVGYALDDAVASTVFRQTGSPVAILLGERVLAASELAAGQRVDRAVLGAALQTLPLETEPQTLRINGREYLAVVGAYPGYTGKEPLRFAVLRSLDEALAPGRQLIRWVLLLSLLAGAGAVGLAAVLAGKLSRPLAKLVELAGQIADGNLQTRVKVEGPAEVEVLGSAMDQMVQELDASRQALAQKQRLEQEMEIAAQLQTSILPSKFQIDGLEVAAKMVPASEVGGDYYDVRPGEGGAWIGIGDVAGHGLSAGVIMMMIQNIVAALIRGGATQHPREVVIALNELLYENVRGRLGRDEHTTLSVIRYFREGRLVYAGAHEEIVRVPLVGPGARLPNPGTWVGAMKDVKRFTIDTTVPLSAGDVLLFYTDGLTEAKNADGEQFGLERVISFVEKRRTLSVQKICDDLHAAVKAFTATQLDDVTLVVARHVG